MKAIIRADVNNKTTNTNLKRVITAYSAELVKSVLSKEGLVLEATTDEQVDIVNGIAEFLVKENFNAVTSTLKQ